MPTIGDARRRFNVRFYVVAMMFLLFDVEIVLLWPWAILFYDVCVRGNTAAQAAIGMDKASLFGAIAIFFVILVVGYVYDWGRACPIAGLSVVEVRRWRWQITGKIRDGTSPGESEDFLTTRLGTWCSFSRNWSRKNSLWPLPFATACCGIELMATARAATTWPDSGEVMRFSPRQADLLICAGRVGHQDDAGSAAIYMQMTEPKWVISMGGLRLHGRSVRRVRDDSGHRPVHAGGRLRAGLPAASGSVDPGRDGHPADRGARGREVQPGAGQGLPVGHSRTYDLGVRRPRDRARNKRWPRTR